MAVITNENISGDLFRSLQQSNNLLVIGGFTQGERNIYAKTPFALSTTPWKVWTLTR